MKRDDEVTLGSNNVFADLELPDAEEMIKKAPLALAITHAIQDQGLTHEEAARRMGLVESDVAGIIRGRLRGFSIGRLVDCLNSLDREVEMIIRAKDPQTPRAQFTIREEALAV